MFTKISETQRAFSSRSVAALEVPAKPVTTMTAVARLVVTVFVWLLAGYIIITSGFDEGTKKWATGLIGASLGYWLG